MMARSRKKPAQAPVKPEAGDMSERSRKGYKEADPQIRKLMDAREDAEREGRIAGMVECAAIARDWNAGNDETRLGRRIANDIITELRRRYGAHEDRIAHHMRLQGLP